MIFVNDAKNIGKMYPDQPWTGGSVDLQLAHCHGTPSPVACKRWVF